MCSSSVRANVNIKNLGLCPLALALVFWAVPTVAEKPPKRAIDPKKAAQTVPLAQDEGAWVERLEDELPKLSSAETKVESGQMKQEEYSKILESATKKTLEAVQTHPKSAAVHVSAARVMIQAGKFEEARQYASRAADLAPDDPWPVVNRGIAEFESCDFPAASRSALEALKRDPRNQNASAMWNLSQRPAGCNNITDKLRSRYVGGKLLEASAPGRIPSADVFGEGGPSAFDAGAAPDPAAADAVSSAGSPAERYTREGFQRFQALMGRAATAMKSHEDERAFDLATAAILAFPENPAALFIRGVAGLNLGRLDTVATDATWGMKLDPANKAKWLGMRSNAEGASGRFDAALADAQAALRLDPNAADAWLALAKVKESLNHPREEWVADFKRAAELNAAFTPAYEQALARAEGRQSGSSNAAIGGVGGLSSRDRSLALVGVVAAGGLLLGWAAMRLLGGSRRRDDQDRGA